MIRSDEMKNFKDSKTSLNSVSNGSETSQGDQWVLVAKKRPTEKQKNCLLSERLKSAPGFGLFGEIRPWLRGPHSLRAPKRCCWCRQKENGQEHFLKYFEEHKKELQKEHAASSGKLVSDERTSWRDHPGNFREENLKRSQTSFLEKL